MPDHARVPTVPTRRRLAARAGTRAGWLLAPALLFSLGLAPMAQAQETVIKAHGISTFGDLKYPEGFARLDYVNPDAPKGGEISVWASGGFDSMHPYTAKGRAGALSSGFFESMLTGTADEIGASYCLICETIEYPEDRSWVIFNMRPDVKFSDGSPLTEEDVMFSYETFLSKGLSSFRAVLSQQVEKAEILGPLRVKFTFKPGYPTRDLPETVGGLPIFSKAEFIAKGRDFEASTLEPMLGSGPYLLDRMDVGKTLVYRRNPDYWGASHPLNVGRNNFDRIRIEYYGDYQAAFEGFKSGNYTFRNEASSLIWATGYDFPAITKGWAKQVMLDDGTIASGQSFVFNLRREKFQDQRVREAIGLMFNFEWSNTTLFYGLYTRINSFWENSELAATGLPLPEEMAVLEPAATDLPPGVLTDAALMAPVAGENQLDRANVRKASALLDAAGWAVGDDGMRRNAKGETLVVEFLNDSQTFDRVINPYVENLRRIGVDAKMTRVDDAEITNRQRSHNFDMLTAQLGQGYIPGSGLQQYFGSASTGDVFNVMGLQNPGIDKLIATVEAARTRDEMTVSVRALDRALRSLQFWVPQWYKNKHTVAYYDMYEHPDPLPPYALGELDFWWYNAEKAEKLKAEGAF